MASAKPKGGRQILVQNRKARHDYEVLDTLECGIVLVGTEVKVLREGKGGLTGAFASVGKDGQLWLHSVTIPPYTFGNRFNHDSLRDRKLLAHAREIRRLRAQVEQKGNTLVPLALYLVKGRVKVELAICKGKNAVDRRETIRRRETDRDIQREMARHFR
jgi:SsrA-binding protein